MLAQVEQNKLAASIVDDQRQAQTDRLKLAFEDDRSRAEAAVTAWVNAYATAAVNQTPLPDIAEFKAALRSQIPLQALFVPPPAETAAPPPPMAAPPPPALGVPSGGVPGRAIPTARPPGVPVTAPVPPVGGGAGPARPAPAPDPASILAMRRALTQGGSNLAGATLANRAMLPPRAEPSGR